MASAEVRFLNASFNRLGAFSDGGFRWSLHDLMKKAASQEEACALRGAIHEVFECNLLGFLRSEAGKGAWQQVTGRSVTARQAQEIRECNIR
jgi:hypothetical protein